ncbi:MAG TPA: carboxypeptidase-like regulatory domain-containing protein [Candidatus Kapabacteria bacterium]|jgi:uncharacterized protein affecting Mg2+/Co2+ transport|nr:carboxypeptidase-like regulatory domain-containing protein [Candidatus Kapabacteria bacterium]
MKRNLGIVAAAVILALTFSLALEAQQETFTYSGRIAWRMGKIKGKAGQTDMTGKPVVGAKVRMGPGNYTATTDAQGRFTITGIPRGSYTMHVKAKEHSSMTRWVVVNENESQDDLTLVWRHYRLGKANRNVQG